jgi:hypothetical protein
MWPRNDRGIYRQIHRLSFHKTRAAQKTPPPKFLVNARTFLQSCYLETIGGFTHRPKGSPLIRHGPHRKRRFQKFLAAAGKCSSSRCLVTRGGYNRQAHRLSFTKIRKAYEMTRPTILLLLGVFLAAVTFLQSRCLATIGGYTYRHTDWWEWFMKYAVQMGLGAMIYVPNFIKTGSGNRKLIEGGYTYRQHGNRISLFQFFQNKESWLKTKSFIFSCKCLDSHSGECCNCGLLGCDTV